MNEDDFKTLQQIDPQAAQAHIESIRERTRLLEEKTRLLNERRQWIVEHPIQYLAGCFGQDLLFRREWRMSVLAWGFTISWLMILWDFLKPYVAW